MGAEIGQFREWAYAEGIEYFLLEYDRHKQLQHFNKKLNEFYKNTPAFYQIEKSWDGFEWLAADDADRNFIAYQRKDRKGETIVVMINFSGSDFFDYKLGLPEGKYQVVFNTDSARFGGSGNAKQRIYYTKQSYSHGKEHSITFNLPKLTCVYLKKQ